MNRSKWDSFWNNIDDHDYGWSTALSKVLFFCAIVLAMVNLAVVLSTGNFTIWRAFIVPALWIFGTYKLMKATDFNPDFGKAVLTVLLFALLIGGTALSLML